MQNFCGSRLVQGTAMNILIVLLILLASILAIVSMRMFRHAGKINDYFANAVTVYVWIDKEDAKIAALAASKVAGSKQRNSMLKYLEGLNSDMTKLFPTSPQLKPFTEKLSELQMEIGAKDWTTKDIIQEKQRLKNYNPEYLNALEKADANIFIRKYPDLFRRKD